MITYSVLRSAGRQAGSAGSGSCFSGVILWAFRPGSSDNLCRRGAHCPLRETAARGRARLQRRRDVSPPTTRTRND